MTNAPVSYQNPRLTTPAAVGASTWLSVDRCVFHGPLWRKGYDWSCRPGGGRPTHILHSSAVAGEHTFVRAVGKPGPRLSLCHISGFGLSVFDSSAVGPPLTKRPTWFQWWRTGYVKCVFWMRKILWQTRQRGFIVCLNYQGLVFWASKEHCIIVQLLQNSCLNTPVIFVYTLLMLLVEYRCYIFTMCLQCGVMVLLVWDEALERDLVCAHFGMNKKRCLKVYCVMKDANIPVPLTREKTNLFRAWVPFKHA